MSRRVVGGEIRTDNEILVPGALDDPHGVIESLPGPKSLRWNLWNACQGVETWFSK